MSAISAFLSLARFGFMALGVLSLDLARALWVLAYFAVSIGYGIGTEWFWRGQTLGKRLLSAELSPVELAMLARNDEEDHRDMDAILAEHGREGFPRAWLSAQGFPHALEEEVSDAAD